MSTYMRSYFGRKLIVADRFCAELNTVTAYETWSGPIDRIRPLKYLGEGMSALQEGITSGYTQ